MLLERGHYLVFIAPHLEPAFTANHQLRPARCAHMRRIGLKIARNYPELPNLPPAADHVLGAVRENARAPEHGLKVEG